MLRYPRRRQGVVLGLALALLPALYLQAEAPEPGKAILLTGARLLTQSDAGDFTGAILIKDGKIVAVGPDVTAPPGAQRIDLTGFTIAPGLIDARSSLWLTPDVARENGRDGRLQILDAINPYSEDWQDVVRQGVTTVCVQPKGSIAGFSAVLKVAPARSADDLIIKSNVALAAALSTGIAPAPQAEATPQLPFPIPGGRGGNFQMPPQPQAPPANNSLVRFAQFEALRRFLDGVKNAPSERGGRKDPIREAQAAVVAGKLPLRVEAHYDDDLKNVQKLAADMKLKVILEGVSQPRSVAAELKAKRTPVILGPILDIEAPTAIRKTRAADWPSNFLADDARFALGTYSDQPRASQWLRVHAAALVAKGIAPRRVLGALTRDAADLLGVGDQLGRLEVGRRATLSVFAGDPLDPTAQTRLVLVDGQIVLDQPHVQLHATNGKTTSAGFLAAAFAPEGSDESADAVTAELRPADRLDPQSKALHKLRAAGFTSAVLTPPSANVVAGQLVGCELQSTRAVPGKVLGYYFVLSAAARNRERYPNSLAGQVELIDAALSGKPLGTRLYLPEFMQERLVKARQTALRELIAQKQVAYIEAETAPEIDAALALIEKHGLKAVLVRPRDFRPFLEVIKRLEVALLVRPLENSDTSRTWNDLAAASKAGVPLLFGGAAPELLRATAASLVQAGADPDRVVAGLAMEGQRLGLVVQTPTEITWSGAPLDLRSQPVRFTEYRPTAQQVTDASGGR
jgi:imidazolonepropionase-like amidohydrolase